MYIGCRRHGSVAMPSLRDIECSVHLHTFRFIRAVAAASARNRYSNWQYSMSFFFCSHRIAFVFEMCAGSQQRQYSLLIHVIILILLTNVNVCDLRCINQNRLITCDWLHILSTAAACCCIGQFKCAKTRKRLPSEIEMWWRGVMCHLHASIVKRTLDLYFVYSNFVSYWTRQMS